MRQSRPNLDMRQSRLDIYETVNARFWLWVDSGLGLRRNEPRWRLNEEAIVDVCRGYKVMREKARMRQKQRKLLC